MVEPIGAFAVGSDVACLPTPKFPPAAPEPLLCLLEDPRWDDASVGGVKEIAWTVGRGASCGV